MDTTFVAVGPFAWGKGADTKTAVKNCKRHIPRSILGKGTYPINVFEVVGFDNVSDMGSVSYDPKGSCKKVAASSCIVR